ncbi:MAG TPA: M1 family metallopeptidase [Candidatus Saccharimonadales bacterium]
MSKDVAHLFELFQPEHYTLQLDPDGETREVRGRVTILGQKKGRPSQRLTFHQHGLKITSASITKHDKKGDQEIAVARINVQKSLDEVRLHTESLLHAGSYSVTLEFVAPVQNSMTGIYGSPYEVAGEKKLVISTQFESHFARQAFPCIDEPEAKATFDLTLTVPQGQVGLSNMPVSKQEEKDGRVVITFETTPRMSTYLLAFAIGDYQSRETKTKDGVLVRTWTTKDHSPESIDFALECAKRGIEFFNDYYGAPYPLPKQDLISVPNFSAGAMENWGLITFRESVFVAEPGSISQGAKEYVSLVICHELSHMWFGDLVTMKWWNDLWLNESFANVMEYVATDGLFPEWQIFNQFVTSEGLAAFRRDSIAGIQPIKTAVHHPDEISTLFDPSIVYAKGGRLLNMLRTYIGEDDFRKGLTAYFTKHAYKNTVGADLWAALSEASGKDVAAFMNPWLEQPNFPVVTVDQQGGELRLSQSHFLLDAAKADAARLWPVPLLATSEGVPALLETSTADVKLSVPDYVRLNQNAVGHYIVHYTRPEHAAWLAGLAERKELNEVERLMLLSDSSLLARAGKVSFDSTLSLLEHYTQETSDPVWDIMALILADGRRFIDADPTLEDSIKALVRSLIEAEYKRLGWQETDGESTQDTKLRASILGLGVYADHEDITKEALELFEAYKTDPSAVSAELRGIAFGAAARHDVSGAVDWLLEQDKTVSNPDIKADILGGLTATHSPEVASRLLARLQNPDLVRMQDVDHWLVFLMRNRYTREVAWQWMQDNWAWIEQTYKGDQNYDHYPRYAASCFSTREYLEQYKAFFGPKTEQVALAHNITLGIEEIENRVAWLERDLAAVQAYFKK